MKSVVFKESSNMLINFGKFELKPEDGDQESKDG